MMLADSPDAAESGRVRIISVQMNFFFVPSCLRGQSMPLVTVMLLKAISVPRHYRWSP
jgi:hypothetical protein